MIRIETQSYPVTIFVAGTPHSLHEIDRVCQRYCDEVGLCVTLTRTDYAYTGGRDDGFAIGLINYGRFPSSPDEIFAKAESLALRIIQEPHCSVESASIQAPDKTLWLNNRESTARKGAA